ncbi:hypothetical protein HDU83_002864 [Entophlyctis luteolus]|nr:hypothetical protein HDU83_002864 [Entophlyctis luteolus]
MSSAGADQLLLLASSPLSAATQAAASVSAASAPAAAAAAAVDAAATASTLASLAAAAAAAAPALHVFAMLRAWAIRMLMALVLRIMRLGPVPRHVAFIMDGNRRFARKRGLDVSRGHAEGADTLEQTLDWCLRLGFKTVTVYAFSTENFGRDKTKEVDPIMRLCAEKFDKFCAHSHAVQKHNVSVQVHGRRDLLPATVQRAAALAQRNTARADVASATLNICMPYTSREEIAAAMRAVVRAVEDGALQPSDIDARLIEQCFWTGGRDLENSNGVLGGGDVDILVRTSGEVRLSDFMLWQVSKQTQINFLDVFWPDFTFWHMLPVLIQYQLQQARSFLFSPASTTSAACLHVDDTAVSPGANIKRAASGVYDCARCAAAKATGTHSNSGASVARRRRKQRKTSAEQQQQQQQQQQQTRCQHTQQQPSEQYLQKQHQQHQHQQHLGQRLRLQPAKQPPSGCCRVCSDDTRARRVRDFLHALWAQRDADALAAADVSAVP